MSDVKVDIIAKVTGGAADDLKKIDDATKGLDGSMKAVEVSAERADKSLKKASSPVTAAGLRDAAAASLAVAAALTAATVAGAIADERHQQALRALGSAYGEVQAATEGTVTATEAWHTQQALLQSGLPTTGRELALITRAARDYARATGTETPQAIEQLSQALVNGEAGGLRRFGIAVQQGATRTQTFESALRQLSATQLHTAPATRTLAEEVAHLQTILTEGGGALAGFLSQALGLPDAIEAIGQSVHRNASALTDFVDFMGRGASNGSTGAVRGIIGGVRPSRRAAVQPTAAQAAMIAAAEAQGARAAGIATEQANAPASGGGASGPSLESRQWAALQAQIVHARAAAAAHATQSAAEAAMVAERAQREKDELTALVAARATLSDEERRGRHEQTRVARDQRDAEIALREAMSGAPATEARTAARAADHTAAMAAIAEVDARIERARTENASQEATNALLRERNTLLAEAAASAPAQSALIAQSAEAMKAFTSAMGSHAESAASAIATAGFAAAEAGENVAAASAQALKASMKALAIESVPQVFKNLALGTAAVFTAPAAAPAFFTAAGLWGAVGVAAGAVSAAIPAASPKPASAPAASTTGGAASAGPARVTGESAGPLTLVVNVSGAMFNEGVQESIVRGLDAAHARGLSPRFARGN